MKFPFHEQNSIGFRFAITEQKFKINIGDHIEVVSTAEGILLKPSTKKKQDIFVSDRLFGIFAAYALKKQKHTKDDISKATEAGFTEGWSS